MTYEPLPFTGYNEDSVALIEWSAGKMFTSDREEFLRHVQRGLDGDEESQMTAVAMMAANCGCPVPGNALQSRMERLKVKTPASPKEQAWYTTLQDYAFWAATIDSLVYILEAERDAAKKKLDLLEDEDADDEEITETIDIQDRKIRCLTMKVWRKPGAFVAPDWPVSAHQKPFSEGVAGVVNPVSFAIGRIFREGMRSFSSQEDARDYWLDLAENVTNITRVEDEIDFLLQVADHAVGLGAPIDKVINAVLSKGYLIAENNLRSLAIGIMFAINSNPEKYPRLFLDEDFRFFTGE